RSGRRLLLFPALGNQSKLRLLPDALIRMLQELDHLFNGPLVKSLGQQFLHFLNRGALALLRISDAINAALSGSFPAEDPVADVQAAIGAEIAVGGEDGPGEFVLIDHFEARALRFDGKGADAAAGGIAAKIAEEKMARVTIGQGRDAGVVAETGWA